jgi:hypothetical protein
VNSPYWDAQPSIAPDKSRLYFVSNRPGPHGEGNLDIWYSDISESRMKITVRNLPQVPSNLNDPQGIVENRRVELICNDWEVVKPIISRDPKRFPSPEQMTFLMRNGIEDALVASRRIEITRGGASWRTLTDIGTTAPSDERARNLSRR